MAARSLFNIVLKILGIYFIKDFLISIPQFVFMLYQLGAGDAGAAFTTFLITAFTLLMYGIVVYYLLFRTDLLIDKLQLVKGMPEDPVPLNIHRSTVVAISVLVLALYLIADTIPELIRGLARLYQYRQLSRNFYEASPFDFGGILVSIGKIIIGFLLVGYQRRISAFIESKTRKQHD